MLQVGIIWRFWIWYCVKYAGTKWSELLCEYCLDSSWICLFCDEFSISLAFIRVIYNYQTMGVLSHWLLDIPSCFLVTIGCCARLDYCVSSLSLSLRSSGILYFCDPSYRCLCVLARDIINSLSILAGKSLLVLCVAYIETLIWLDLFEVCVRCVT